MPIASLKATFRPGTARQEYLNVELSTLCFAHECIKIKVDILERKGASYLATWFVMYI